MQLSRSACLSAAVALCMAGPVLAQAAKAPAAPATPAPAAAPAPAPAAEPAEAPPQAWRTEILNIEAWTVTCQDFLLPKPNRLCAAQLRVVRQGTAQVIMALNVSLDEAGRPKGLLTTPTGVLVSKGVDLAVAAAPPRKLAYEACDASQCTAAIVFDERLAKELQAAANVDVTLTAVNGSAIKVGFGVKGFDKALAALGAKP